MGIPSAESETTPKQCRICGGEAGEGSQYCLDHQRCPKCGAQDMRMDFMTYGQSEQCGACGYGAVSEDSGPEW